MDVHILFIAFYYIMCVSSKFIYEYNYESYRFVCIQQSSGVGISSAE